LLVVFLAGKAAAISSAMLTRRKSSNIPTDGKIPIIGNGSMRTTNVARESVAVLAEMLAFDTSIPKARNSAYFFSNMCLVDTLMKIACISSMVSVCLNTPDTLKIWHLLRWVIFFTDVTVTVIFSIEALIKIITKSSTKSPYFSDRWCQFDFFLLLCHYLSLCLQGYEISCIFFPKLGWSYYSWYGILRSPRPFIMIRVVREFIKFKLPKNRIKQIIKRSSQQIQNVTIFFLFFMALYAIMGVQLFGRLEYHCVLPETDPNNVTIADLAIPDTMCSKEGLGGYQCPGNTVCMKLKLSTHQQGYYGMFNDFGKGN
jgi:hypothetical protein